MGIILSSHGINNTVNTIPTLSFPWSSNGDTNGFFYYLGTNLGTTSFINPQTRGLVDSFFWPSTGGSTVSAQNLLDRDSSTGCSTISNDQAIYYFDTVSSGKMFRPKIITVKPPNGYSLTNTAGDCSLRCYVGTADHTVNLSITGGTNEWWKSSDLSSSFTGFYKAFEFNFNLYPNKIVRIGEIEIYGELKL